MGRESRAGRGRRAGPAGVLAHEDLYRRDGRGRRYHREPEKGPVRESRGEDRRREHGADHRSGRVHRPLDAEGAAVSVRGTRLRYERVARRRPDPLAGAVDEPEGEHLTPPGREREDGAGEDGQAVAEQDRRFALPEAVRDHSRDHAEERGRRFREAGDETDGDGSGAEGREKYGKERVDHLARDVHEEAHPAEGEDGPSAEPLSGRPAAARVRLRFAHRLSPR